MLMRAAGLRCGRSRIAAGCFFSGDVRIGASTYINRECIFDGSAPIEIGERCAFGMRVMVITNSHTIGPPMRRASTERESAKVTIGDGTWVGAGAVIMPGVTIGPGCVIAAGAVVTADCPPNGLYAGVPATRKRELGGAPGET